MNGVHADDKRDPAQGAFFLTAALFAVVAPWLLLPLPGQGTGLVDSTVHARGMLFGLVGALIAGYLGGKLLGWHMAVLLGLWFAGRLSEVFAADTPLMHFCYAGFGLGLALLVVPRFSTAKKWRNRLTGPTLAAITCFPLLLLAGKAIELDYRSAIHSLAILVAWLMFYMGGRFITPLLARAYANLGDKSPQRIQPLLEGAVMILLLLAAVLRLFPVPNPLVGALLGLAGILIIVRLARWRLFRLGPRHVDLKGLGAGYLWLGAGLVAFSVSLSGHLEQAASLHLITIGALGTLSSTVMLKSTHTTGRGRPIVYYTMIALVGLACLARVATGVTPDLRTPLLYGSAALWSVNFLLVACHLTTGTLEKSHELERKRHRGAGTSGSRDLEAAP